MTFKTLLLSTADRVLTITLNRPDKLNALNPTMGEELIQAFNAASFDDSVGAIVVTGAGRTFCAGADLQPGDDVPPNQTVFGFDRHRDVSLEALQAGYEKPEMVAGIRDLGGRINLAIFDCNKPVIAAINGPSVGIGSTLPLAMDIRLASENARFGFVFGKVGISPDACSTWFLPRIVGMTKAMELTLTGELIGADTAQRIQLVSEVLAPEHLLARAHEIARRLANERSELTMAMTRHMMWRNSAMESPHEAHAVESLALLHTTRMDGVEGVAAFLEKRPARFKAGVSQMPGFFSRWLAKRQF